MDVNKLKLQKKDESIIINKKKNKRIKKIYYIVTERQFKTRKKTYKISKIEKTEIRRNFIFLLPIALLSLIFTYKFWDYLYTGEVFFIISASIITGIASILLGTLYVYSKALGEPALFNFIPVLRRVRNEVDDVMFELEEKNETRDSDFYD